MAADDFVDGYIFHYCIV